jgi:release factor glutamine methyltransferase
MSTPEALAPPATVAAALRWARGRLKASGIEGAAFDARVLLAAVLGAEAATLGALRGCALDGREADRFCRLVDGRAARRPVSRLLGRRGFWTLELAIDDAVLDPRPETETLVEAVLGRVGAAPASLRLLDLGTGSGCLLLALLGALPRAWGVGVDRSQAALACAARNARRLGFADRARFLAGDWGRSLGGSFDVIVANPPYIALAEIERLAPEVRLHEPRLALAGGADGLACYRDLAPDLARLLGPGAVAALECGAGQAAAVADIVSAAGARVIEVCPDLAGVPRCLLVTL